MTTVPTPRSENARSTQSRVGRSARACSTPAAARPIAARSSSMPGAGLRADRDDLRVGDELLRLLESGLEQGRVHRVGLRHCDDAALDPEQPQDREVLERLRPGALSSVDHEQEEVDARRPGDHRADEALVARDVDDRDSRAVRQLERRVAEVDRDAPPPLLREAVRVLAGQRTDEPGLAVVDVTRGADRQRHVRGA